MFLKVTDFMLKPDKEMVVISGGFPKGLIPPTTAPGNTVRRAWLHKAALWVPSGKRPCLGALYIAYQLCLISALNTVFEETLSDFF